VAKIYVSLGMITKNKNSVTKVVTEVNYDINPFISGLLFILVISFIFKPSWYMGLLILITFIGIFFFCRNTNKKSKVVSENANDDDCVLL
jgi:hypothetical protein